MKIDYCDKELIVVSDIHGDYNDFRYYIDLWLEDTENYIVFMGDLIHGDLFEEDMSLKILDSVMEYIDYPTFHVLMGNHELSQLYSEDVFKYNVNQTESFKLLVENEYPDDYIEKYNEYKKLLSKFHYFIQTSNGLCITHAGINEDYLKYLLNDTIDIHALKYNKNSVEKEWITMNLWSRPYEDSTSETINTFLKKIQCKYLITGHTVYNGYHIYGNQLIFDSSYNTDNKYYLRIKLNTEIDSVTDLLKYLIKKEDKIF